MGWIIFSIIIAFLAFAGLGIQIKEIDRYNDKILGWGICKKQFLCILAVLLIIPGFITKVPANSVGIKYSAFNGTSEKTLSEG